MTEKFDSMLFESKQKGASSQDLTSRPIRTEYMAMRCLELYREWVAAGKPRRTEA